ncbi:hypothetical protein GGR51DRAFT_515726 [Nemania sp. FL0031]|nr:hypothetical protein GGR51DRAFT_515726 [Nemania sp. FL0031]
MLEQSYPLSSLGHLAILPPELRNIIYEFVLVDPPKWERPHKRCPHGLQNGYLAHICQLPFKQYSSCRGRVREGISLLRVNKGLHTEASPIFWSQNIFCFLSGDEFIKCVGTYLRSDYRSLLRHIRIIRIGPTRNYSGIPSWWTRDPDYEKKPFEITIRQCTGLRTLGIDINLVTPYQWRPDYLYASYVQILAGMISPKVQFSFLKTTRVLTKCPMTCMMTQLQVRRRRLRGVFQCETGRLSTSHRGRVHIS